MGALEVFVQQERDADGDQHWSQEESKTYAEEEAHRVLAFGGRDSGRENARGVFLAAKNRAENVDIGSQPEFDFIAGLP